MIGIQPNKSACLPTSPPQPQNGRHLTKPRPPRVPRSSSSCIGFHHKLQMCGGIAVGKPQPHRNSGNRRLFETSSKSVKSKAIQRAPWPHTHITRRREPNGLAGRLSLQRESAHDRNHQQAVQVLGRCHLGMNLLWTPCKNANIDVHPKRLGVPHCATHCHIPVPPQPRASKQSPTDESLDASHNGAVCNGGNISHIKILAPFSAHPTSTATETPRQAEFTERILWEYKNSAKFRTP